MIWHNFRSTWGQSEPVSFFFLIFHKNSTTTPIKYKNIFGEFIEHCLCILLNHEAHVTLRCGIFSLHDLINVGFAGVEILLLHLSWGSIAKHVHTQEFYERFVFLPINLTKFVHAYISYWGWGHVATSLFLSVKIRISFPSNIRIISCFTSLLFVHNVMFQYLQHLYWYIHVSKPV